MPTLEEFSEYFYHQNTGDPNTRLNNVCNWLTDAGFPRHPPHGLVPAPQAAPVLEPPVPEPEPAPETPQRIPEPQ